MAYLGSTPARAPLSSAQIEDGTIAAADLADSAVTTAKLANNGVTTAKLANNGVTAAKVSSDVSQLGKNLIHNGAMLVDQRASDTRTGLGAADTLLCDRWRCGANGSPSARWTISVETSGGPATGTRWLKCLNTTADASPGSSEAFTLRQAMEAQNLQSLVTSGTIGAMTISGKAIAHVDGASSISFPAKLACGVTTSDGTARQYYTDITFAAADTWTDFSITIPADGTATIDNNTGQGLNFQFGIYGGSGRVASTATWENDGADSITSNSDNWADATNNYIGFTQIQIEAGTVATDFEHEDYGTTLAKCLRYFWRAANGDQVALWNITQTSAGFGYPHIQWPLPFRTNPTMSYSNLSHFAVAPNISQTNPSEMAISYSGTNGAWITIGWSASGSAGDAVRFYTISSSATLDFSADL